MGLLGRASLRRRVSLRVKQVEHHDDALRQVIDLVEARLTVASMIGAGSGSGFDRTAAPPMIRAVRSPVDTGGLVCVPITATNN